MPRNKIEDLRNHLFEAMEMLKDKEMDIDTAKAMADIAQVIINSAKVEVQYLKETGMSKVTNFMLENKNE